MRLSLLLLIGLFTFATSCQNDDSSSNIAKERKDIVLSRSEEVLAEDNMDFAFRLFKQVNSTETQRSNWMISPFSASLALGMMSNGAAGNTLEEMKNVLGFSNFDLNGMNAYNKKLITELLDLDNTTQLNIANSIWVNKDFQLYNSFVDKNKDIYNAQISNLDFSSSNTPNTINRWCADYTNNSIDKIVNKVPSTTKMILLNALYFKGTWKKQFKKSDTKKEKFSNADGSVSDVLMMNQKEYFTYIYNKEFCVAEFPYGDGAYSMLILLPSEGNTLDHFLDNLTFDNWKEWYEQRYSQRLIVKFPRFEMVYEKELVEIMKSMGIKDAFNNDVANFSGVSSDGLSWDSFKQAVCIRVNEEGTEAASVSKGDLKPSAPTPSVPEPFYVDRPFAFMIKEQSTDTILFMGKVTKL